MITRNRAALAALALAGLSLAGTAQAAVCKASAALDGNYKANDQGSYQIRTVGANVWWIGKSADNGASWTNVFKGTRKGNIVTGSWADITADGGSGTLTLRVTQNNQLQRIDATGAGFGGSIWLRPGCTFSKAVPID